MTKETKSEVINLRVTQSLKKALQALADEDRRTLSDYIAIQLENLTKKGKK